ncbi:hypothetical protein DL95DRAFT_467569 [Leptodontidium sp. 2 PMI_412]|nr:hypothetical protein DL95DRAFT_467569 [Leptodontidium sp. 2 PMI_412]
MSDRNQQDRSTYVAEPGRQNVKYGADGRLSPIQESSHGEKEYPNTEYEATRDLPRASTNYGDNVQGNSSENSTPAGYQGHTGGSRRHYSSTSFQAEDIPEKSTPRKPSRRDHSLLTREWAAVSSSDQLSGSLAKLTIREVQGSQQDPTSSKQYDLPPYEEVGKGHDTSYHGKGKGVEREWPRDAATEDIPGRTFFRPGRVFSTLWTESYDTGTQSENVRFRSIVTYQIPYKQKVFSKIRLFVVVRKDDRICTCLPVTTCNGEGSKKKGISLDDHGLIYSSKEPPPHIEGITKAPLRIVLSKGVENIRNPSYINYGRVYTVEANVKVRDVGDLDSTSKKLLRTFYKEVHLRHFPEDNDFAAPGQERNPRLRRDIELSGQPQYKSRGGYDQSTNGGYEQETDLNNAQGVLPPPSSLQPETAIDPQSQSLYRYKYISGDEHHVSQQIDQGWSGTSPSAQARGEEGNYIPTGEEAQQQPSRESARTKYSTSGWGMNQHRPRQEKSDPRYVQGPPISRDFTASSQVPPGQPTHVDSLHSGPGASYSGMDKAVSDGISTEDTNNTNRYTHGLPSGNAGGASFTFSSDYYITQTQGITGESWAEADSTATLSAEQLPPNSELDSMAKRTPETNPFKSADGNTTLPLPSKEPVLSRSCSIEDLESLFSYKESNSSRSSYTDEPQGAERLAELLLKDEELQDLYKVATQKVTSERLRENFRRCLVQCSAHLKEKVARTKSAAGLRCAKVLRHYSRNAAAQVALCMVKQKTIDTGADSEHILDVGNKSNFQDESDDEDEDEGEGDDDWQEAVQLEDILVSSEAFKLLKENFGLYLNPDPVKRALFRTWPVSHQRSNPLEIVYHAPWIIPSFLKSSFAGDQALKSFLTVSGSGLNAQAQSCGDYIAWSWPECGGLLLEAFQDLLEQTSTGVEKRNDYMVLKLNVLNKVCDTSVVSVTVTAVHSMHEKVASAISWLCAAIRPSSHDHVTYSSVSIEAPKAASKSRTIEIQLIDLEEGFQNPSSLLPDGSVQWHFEYKRSGHCRKPRKLFEVLKQAHLIKRYRTVDIEDLVQRRCFLGWVDEVEVLIGTEAFSATTISWSEGDKAQGTGHLKSHGITTGTEGLGIFGVTANRTWLPVSVPSRIILQPNKDIADTLDDECDARAMVYDTGTKIAHLLPQADITLFLAHKILQRRQLFLLDGNQATSLDFASLNVKAVDILRDSLDLKMVKCGRSGNSSTRYFGDIVKEIWNALDMIENALVSNKAEWSTIEKGAPKFLHGVEFRDLESMKPCMTILQVKLNKPWVHLVISEPTIPVLFCQGLGQAIVPRNPKMLCRPWISVPLGENYMVATCMTICSWLDRHNNGEGSRLSERVEWNVDPRASRDGLIYCHSTKKNSFVFHEQQLNFVKKASRNAKIYDLVMGHERGGLIFGSTRWRKGCSEKLDQSSSLQIRTTSLDFCSRIHLKQSDSAIQHPPDVPEGSSDTSAKTEASFGTNSYSNPLSLSSSLVSQEIKERQSIEPSYSSPIVSPERTRCHPKYITQVKSEGLRPSGSRDQSMKSAPRTLKRMKKSIQLSSARTEGKNLSK